jgi:glutaconyl-CoA/methylmalonyl-CoA decarboxylase subunit gamma
MRLSVEIDGKTAEVEVDPAGGSVRVGERALPVKVVAANAAHVELEIAGERVALDGWPEGVVHPPATVTLNGETTAISVRVVSSVSSTPGALRPKESAPEPRVPARFGIEPPRSSGTSVGAALLPPMPGKVIEVRVREGDRVTAGQIVLVLEAMKMRNEIAAPVGGVVRELAVAPGTNVRARETMLRIVPE